MMAVLIITVLLRIMANAVLRPHISSRPCLWHEWAAHDHAHDLSSCDTILTARQFHTFSNIRLSARVLQEPSSVFAAAASSSTLSSKHPPENYDYGKSSLFIDMEIRPSGFWIRICRWRCRWTVGRACGSGPHQKKTSVAVVAPIPNGSTINHLPINYGSNNSTIHQDTACLWEGIMHMHADHHRIRIIIIIINFAHIRMRQRFIHRNNLKALWQKTKN